jgi:hypothetical protein
MTESNTSPEAVPHVAQASETTSAPESVQASPIKDAFAEKLAKVRGKDVAPPKAQASDAVKPEQAKNPEVKPDGEKKASNDEKPFKRERDNNRFGELTKRLKEREAEIARLTKVVESQKAPKERKDYETDEGYIQDLARHAAGKQVFEPQLEALKQTQQREEREIWEEKVKSTVLNPQVFNQSLKAHLQDIDADTEDYVMSSDVGPRMLEVILEKFADPHAKAEFMRMPKAKRAVLLVNLEQMCLTPSTPQATQLPQAAPKPLPSLAPERGERAPTANGSDFDNKLRQIRNRI